MKSAGMAKILIAFTVGVGLALAGAALYNHLTPRAAAVPAEPASAPLATAAGPDKLPDDDTAATASVIPPPTAPIQQPAAPPLKVKPSVKTATHQPVRHSLPVVLKKTHAQVQPPQQLAQVQPPDANPYTNNQAAMPPPPEPMPTPAVAAQPSPVPQPRVPRTMTIPSGTRLTVRLNQALSSDHNFAGDTFQGTLESPIILNDALIAERGSKVMGKVVNVQRGGHGDAGSDLSVTLTQINTTDGQRVAVQTSVYDQQTKRNGQHDAEKIGGGAALGAIIGALAGGGKGAAIGAGVGGAAGGGDVLLTKGRPAVLQTETQIGFQTTAPITVTEQLNN